MSGTSNRILLVEDDRNEVDVALRALRRAGVEATIDVVHDGLGALEALGLEGEAATNSLPRVVFLDLKMPRVDGLEVLRRIREDQRTRLLPVVVWTSSDRDEDVARSLALGANSFLVKRFDSRGPGTYLAEAARYWVELNRVPAREVTA